VTGVELVSLLLEYEQVGDWWTDCMYGINVHRLAMVCVVLDA
jgi:hypothetical protein